MVHGSLSALACMLFTRRASGNVVHYTTWISKIHIPHSSEQGRPAAAQFVRSSALNQPERLNRQQAARYSTASTHCSESNA